MRGDQSNWSKLTFEKEEREKQNPMDEGKCISYRYCFAG
jgi:hypothetical protein